MHLKIKTVDLNSLQSRGLQVLNSNLEAEATSRFYFVLDLSSHLTFIFHLIKSYYFWRLEAKAKKNPLIFPNLLRKLRNNF